MQSFILACVAAVVIAFGAVYVLEAVQQPASTAYASPTGARI
jgi:hypothetical protein